MEATVLLREFQNWCKWYRHTRKASLPCIYKLFIIGRAEPTTPTTVTHTLRCAFRPSSTLISADTVVSYTPHTSPASVVVGEKARLHRTVPHVLLLLLRFLRRYLLAQRHQVCGLHAIREFPITKPSCTYQYEEVQQHHTRHADMKPRGRLKQREVAGEHRFRFGCWHAYVRRATNANSSSGVIARMSQRTSEQARHGLEWRRA